MNTTSLRTQIYLPKDLRADIDRVRGVTGETLAEYLRKAAKEKLEREKKRKLDLKKLAREVLGSVKKSSWEGINVVKWQREIRTDRDNL